MVRARTLDYTAALTFAVLALASSSTSAADKKDKPGLTGVWTQTEGEIKIEFADNDVMKVFPHGENDAIIVICSYSIGDDAVVKAKITEIQGEAKDKVKEILPIGLEFSFKWRVKDKIATLDDLKSDEIPKHFEGKYDRKS